MLAKSRCHGTELAILHCFSGVLSDLLKHTFVIDWHHLDEL
jgi:hypothetical protein